MIMSVSKKRLYLFLSVKTIVITGTGVSDKNINDVTREGFYPNLSNTL